VRRGGQVVHADQVLVLAQRLDQRAVGAGVGRVERDVDDALDELRIFGLVRRLDVRLGGGLDAVQELVLRPLVAADADDARARRQVAGNVARVHRRHQLAHRQVAAAAKKDKVKVVDCHK
jgi:hypothetical protein